MPRLELSHFVRTGDFAERFLVICMSPSKTHADILCITPMLSFGGREQSIRVLLPGQCTCWQNGTPSSFMPGTSALGMLLNCERHYADLVSPSGPSSRARLMHLMHL